MFEKVSRSLKYDSKFFLTTNIIGERAKRARHSISGLFNRESWIYIIIVRANFVLITRKEGGA